MLVQPPTKSPASFADLGSVSRPPPAEYRNEVAGPAARRSDPARRAAWRFAAALRPQGFLPTEHFVQRIAERALGGGVRFDPRTFAAEFLRARHYRQLRPGYATRIAVVRGVPVLYRLGGRTGGQIVLAGALPPDAPLPPTQRTAPPRRTGEDAWASEVALPPSPPQQPPPTPQQPQVGGGQRLIAPWELVTRRITVPASGRGVTDAMRADLQAVAARHGSAGPIDVAHVTPHVFTQPGDSVLVRPQARSVNRGEGRAISAQAAARRAQNANPASAAPMPVRPKK